MHVGWVGGKRGNSGAVCNYYLYGGSWELLSFINITSDAPSRPQRYTRAPSLFTAGNKSCLYQPRVLVAHHCSAQSTVHCTCFNSLSPCVSTQSTIFIANRLRLCARRYGMKTSGLRTETRSLLQRSVSPCVSARNPLFSLQIACVSVHCDME